MSEPKIYKPIVYNSPTIYKTGANGGGGGGGENPTPPEGWKRAFSFTLNATPNTVRFQSNKSLVIDNSTQSYTSVCAMGDGIFNTPSTSKGQRISLVPNVLDMGYYITPNDATAVQLYVYNGGSAKYNICTRSEAAQRNYTNLFSIELNKQNFYIKNSLVANNVSYNNVTRNNLFIDWSFSGNVSLRIDFGEFIIKSGEDILYRIIPIYKEDLSEATLYECVNDDIFTMNGNINDIIINM